MKQLRTFIESIEMDSILKKAILNGFNVVFMEGGFDSWGPNVTPLVPQQGYVNAPKSNSILDKMVPAGITGIGGAGSANGTGYTYEPACSEQMQRSIGEETKMDKWGNPKFQKLVTSPSKSLKTLIKNAQERIPRGEENVYAPTGAGSMMIGGLTTANFPAYDANLIQGGAVGGSTGASGGSPA